ncbi:hypothetical protein JOB18_002151 [Solea senegalensis]|uniref:Uncharacterized protein n=1 Tax=Solea senegalensis TaxID=28829 RepID=A0AAV6R718_SOLSE|nr:hypothetical protein JOB18_002151 [Solea senegalensis]
MAAFVRLPGEDGAGRSWLDSTLAEHFLSGLHINSSLLTRCQTLPGGGGGGGGGVGSADEVNNPQPTATFRDQRLFTFEKSECSSRLDEGNTCLFCSLFAC